MQLIYTSSFNGSRLEEREYITQIFKSIATDLNVPILVLSQLTRDMTNYENQDFSHLKLTESNLVSPDGTWQTELKSKIINPLSG